MMVVWWCSCYPGYIICTGTTSATRTVATRYILAMFNYAWYVSRARPGIDTVLLVWYLWIFISCSSTCFSKGKLQSNK